MTTAVLERADVTAPAAEPPKNLTVRDLKAGAFSRVKEDFKNPADAIEILNYIDFLAQNNSMSADDLELPFLNDGTKKEWKLDRAETTKLFFGHVEAKSEELKKNVKLPDEAARAAILAAANTRKEASKRRIVDQEKNHIRQATEYYQHAQNQLGEARKMREQIELMEGTDDTKRLQELVDGIAATNWNFHEFKNGYMFFVSRSDIILRHIEPKAGLNYELNCGKFKLEIKMDNMSVRMLAFERCVPAGAPFTNIHPHVNTSGGVCFGNGEATAAEARVSGDILKMLRLLDALLPNYGEVPFIGIKDFKRAIDYRDRLERENYGKAKEGEKGAPQSPEAIDDQEILDDEPDFTDEDIEWTGGEDE